ncbi:hypothetical protein GO986_16250 [Deinococcus sp. HMF7620]|uniref:Uncharacterized protein n=1 Tax=Deinococcus arboris TaxID=2682977 RepID=A0A7C9LML0_9DEIO|nr:hypothetical protein [Deinococcus arboris]MVN88298.1 hypothetical protein [Deinococcus arboris]
MKAKVTGVSAWQGTPTGGTLSVRVPRYADSSGNASVSEYSGVLDPTHSPPRWLDARDPTKELWLVVQGPDDPPAVRATFYEVLHYPSKVVTTEFSRTLVSSDLQGLLFDYAAPEPSSLPAGFGDAPLTMRAAQQLLDDGVSLVAGLDTALDDVAQATQLALSAAETDDTVATEAALAGRPAGVYTLLSTGELAVWTGAAVTFRRQVWATIQTSVGRVADLVALRAYAGGATSMMVSDQRRGGLFRRELSSAAPAVNDGTVFAHSSGSYVWVRVHDPFVLHADWFREPVANTAPQLQRLFNACPRGGTIIGGSKATPDGQLSYWPVAPWTRPDGRTDVLLTLDRAVTLRWDANQYGGYIGYDTATPGTTSILEISSKISADFPGNTTEYGYRLIDLAIIPTTGQPCAKHALILKATAQNNLADFEIRGGQFVATNPDGRAIEHDNDGNNGLFGLRVYDVKVRGGGRFKKLGDSCEFIRGFWAGHASSPAVYISLLDPTNPTDAASQLHVRALNINALGGGFVLEDAATFVVDGLNLEVRNRHEGGAANYGQYAVIFRNCGTRGGLAGQSARAYGGARVTGLKSFPADGGTYDSSSGGFAVLFDTCRATYFGFGAVGTSQVLSPDGTPAANGLGATLRACDDMTVDLPDLQLTTNAIGLDIEATTKNTRLRGATVNPIVASSWTAIRDLGLGTMGLLKVLTPSAGLEVPPGAPPLQYVKDESGVVHLFGSVRPAGGSGDIVPYLTLGTLPKGFTPAAADIARRVLHYDVTPGGADPQPTIRHLYMRLLDNSAGACLAQLNAWSNGAQDTTAAGVRDMHIDTRWQAVRA